MEGEKAEDRDEGSATLAMSSIVKQVTANHARGCSRWCIVYVLVALLESDGVRCLIRERCLKHMRLTGSSQFRRRCGEVIRTALVGKHD